MTPEISQAVAKDLVRAVRGRRSQAEFSRRIRYRSNIAQRWETGDCWPTAAAFLTACARVKPGTIHCFRQYFTRQPDWFSPTAPFTAESIAHFLRDIRGKTPILTLAERTGCNRYSVGRWLKGTAQPKLPEFLALIEAASRRLPDFVATIVDPRQLPTLAKRWDQLEKARQAAYELPWSHAVLRALELSGSRTTKLGTEKRIAETLGLSVEVVRQALEVLASTGQVKKARGRWRIAQVFAVDTSRDATRARGLKAAWTQVALDRLKAGAPGSFGYSLFAVSRSDLSKLRALHLDYVRAMQTLIAESEPSECVGLYCAQLLDLRVDDNALA